MSHGIVLENHLTEGEEIPPCAMNIRLPDEAVMDTLLSICSEIWRHQGVSDLYMSGVTCNSLTLPRLIKPGTLHLSNCNLPKGFMQILLRQLFGCGET